MLLLGEDGIGEFFALAAIIDSPDGVRQAGNALKECLAREDFPHSFIVAYTKEDRQGEGLANINRIILTALDRRFLESSTAALNIIEKVSVGMTQKDLEPYRVLSERGEIDEIVFEKFSDSIPD